MSAPVPVVIVGAGPYGLSIASHLAARKIEHRIIGRPMHFWSHIAAAGARRFLKSYCFGTNISTPLPGFSFADYSRPRGLETFEPCSIGDFAAYGNWFQQNNVPWLEPVEAVDIRRQAAGFTIALGNGEHIRAARLVIATGLSGFAHVPPVLEPLSAGLALHTSMVTSFSAYRGRRIAVIGAGQSALEAAALLAEAGAHPELLVRESQVFWHSRVSQQRSLWRRLRSPITGLGTGPKAWALTRFPGAVHRLPRRWRIRFVSNHLSAEGAWWLRERVEDRVPVHYRTTVTHAAEGTGGVTLTLQDRAAGTERTLTVDHVVAGSGYVVDVDRLAFVNADLRARIRRTERAPALDANFGTSVPGLYFAGPTAAMSFGPLFRFVVGAGYAARTVANHVAPGDNPA